MKTKSNWTRILLTGASLAAMGALSPAQAQDEDVTEEIVVTATGRTAALQDVPIAVTAVAGEQLENSGADDLRDLTQVAPSFSMGTGQSATATTARIRGIGTGSDNVGFESAVGIFIDGVYRARPGAALSDLPELERVEVLRGPQGTLFGRNTSAGAISVVTAGPDFAPGMSLEGTFGFDDLEEVGTRAMVNMPLSDSFAVRFDGSVRARDGYVTDLISGDDINNRDRYTARGQALWDISSDASLRIIVDAAEQNEVCCGDHHGDRWTRWDAHHQSRRPQHDRVAGFPRPARYRLDAGSGTGRPAHVRRRERRDGDLRRTHLGSRLCEPHIDHCMARLGRGSGSGYRFQPDRRCIP
jgi:outer membrane receptor protein involved in Fe transport